VHGFLWLKNELAIDEMDFNNQEHRTALAKYFSERGFSHTQFLITLDQQLIHAGGQDPQISTIIAPIWSSYWIVVNDTQNASQHIACENRKLFCWSGTKHVLTVLADDR
jgi:hypothetical protein